MLASGFHITPRTPETREQLVTLRLCEWSLAGDQQTCTTPTEKHYLPLIAKDGTTLITLPPALAGVRLLAEVSGCY